MQNPLCSHAACPAPSLRFPPPATVFSTASSIWKWFSRALALAWPPPGNFLFCQGLCLPEAPLCCWTAPDPPKSVSFPDLCPSSYGHPHLQHKVGLRSSSFSLLVVRNWIVGTSLGIPAWHVVEGIKMARCLCAYPGFLFCFVLSHLYDLGQVALTQFLVF